MSTPIPITALNLALFVGFAAAQSARTALFLKPTLAAPEKPFDLEVVSFRWSCGATYSHIESALRGARLDIRFAVIENPNPVCPAIDEAHGPEVPVKALPKGRYDVWATPLMPCLVAPDPCEVPERPERVGFLTVGAYADGDWFASPVATAAGQAFDLRILSEKYGNCHTSFEHKSLEVQRNGRIVASFVIKTDSSRVCIVDTHPHGPGFAVEGIPAGRYPVDVVEIPACVYQAPVCPWIPPEMAARTVDTLVVSGTTSLRDPARRAAVRAGARLERGRVKLEGTGMKTVQGRALKEDKP